MQIYLARNNQQAGPYSLEQLNDMLASQQVLLTDLAWHQGMPEWKALGELTQGQMHYRPEGYIAPIQPAFEPIKTQVSTETAPMQSTELASIPARALAKIIDLLLWLPATFLLTAFFDASQEAQFMKLNEQFIQVMSSSQADAHLAQSLQSQLFQLIPDQAWIAAAIYILVMLAVQAFLLAKRGQSIGKRLTKIKIVDHETAQPVSLMRVFTIRSVLFIVLNLMFMPLSSIIDYAFALGAKRQTLHDKLAKTKVIKQ
jgi:uncharacterized RDD family membrane protein YckC